MTVDVAYSLGRAAAKVLGGSKAVIGRDPRESGVDLLHAVATGLSDYGVDPLDLGIAPTPAIAFVARQRGCTGVMISASHNPWYDNGIKLFSKAGGKLADTDQAAIEVALAEDGLAWSERAAEGTKIESVDRDLGDYVDWVKKSVKSPLTGLKVVLDTANGAGSHIVGPALADLGVDVQVIFNQPDGRNINEACGSTNPEALAAEVVERGADLGVALDGDADRLVTVDHNGRIIDGDHLMAIIAGDMFDRGRLAGNRLVVTVMSNLGLLRAMEARGITVEVTPVGDRAVVGALDQTKASFGGEQSGHLIFRELAPTGDGFLSAVQLFDVLARSNRTLADLADTAMTSFPQVLRNVPVSATVTDVAEQLAEEIQAVSEALGSDGRVLVRSSGTEPVVRVMVEAADAEDAEVACEQLCEVVAERFGSDA